MGRKLKRRYMYIYSWFTSQYSRNEHNIVKHLYCCPHCSVAKSEQSVQLFATPRTAACQTSLSFTVSQSLVKLMSVESVMPSNHLILCRAPLLLPSFFPSIRVFSSECSGLISFRIDWFDLFAVQGTLESSPAPHYKSINSSALNLLYGPNLTSIHDYRKNHSSD